MPQRPIRSLAVVGVLALGDYVLWNWSVGANHDVVALVAGMTLIPLLIALTWLVVVAVARLLAHAAQRPRAEPGRCAWGCSRSGCPRRWALPRVARGGRAAAHHRRTRGCRDGRSDDLRRRAPPGARRSHAAALRTAASPSSKLAA